VRLARSLSVRQASREGGREGGLAYRYGGGNLDQFKQLVCVLDTVCS